jgi:hypothetical protein
MKLLKHPCLLKYYDMMFQGDSACIVFEKASYINSLLDQLSPDEIVVGLFDIAVLKFVTFIVCIVSDLFSAFKSEFNAYFYWKFFNIHNHHRLLEVG